MIKKFGVIAIDLPTVKSSLAKEIFLRNLITTRCLTGKGLYYLGAVIDKRLLNPDFQRDFELDFDMYMLQIMWIIGYSIE